jgi:hypothetical protein
MSDLLWLTEAQMRKIEPYFPLSRCKASLESHRRGVQQDIRRPGRQGGQGGPVDD